MIGVFSLTFILLMSGIAPILVNSLPSSTSSTPLLVTFGTTTAENIAKDQIVKNFPNSQVISFDNSNLMSVLTQTAKNQAVIWIAHGTDLGLSNNGKIVSWDAIAQLVSQSKATNHYFLACESSQISKLTQSTSKDVFSFNIRIDAEFGANLISAYIARSQGDHQLQDIIKSLFSRINALFNGAQEHTLYLGSREKAYHMFNLVMLALMIILPLTMATIPSNVLAKSFLAISAYSSTVAVFKYTVDFFFMIGEGKSVSELLGTFAKLAGALATWIVVFLRVVLSNVGWLTGAKITTVAAGETTLLTQAIKWAAIIAVAIGIAYTIYVSYNAYSKDKNDADDYVTYV